MTAPFVDCGSPQDYLAANLLASGGESVVEPGAVVEGKLDRCVIWSDARVDAGERFVLHPRPRPPCSPLRAQRPVSRRPSGAVLPLYLVRGAQLAARGVDLRAAVRRTVAFTPAA